MEKADFLYFQVEVPNGINFIIFRYNSAIFGKNQDKSL